MFARRFDDGIRQAEKLLEMNPQMRIAIEMKGWATGMKGDWEEAIKYFEEVHRLTNHPLKGMMGLGYAYGVLGMKEKALDVIQKIELRQQQEPDAVLDADLAAIWWGLGNADKTFYHLDQCINKRMGPVSYFLEYPAYKGIKEDPRYAQLKRRLNL
jgi:adenylate cyclase